MQSARVKSNDKKPKSILLKIAPDLTDEQLLNIIDIVKKTKIAGIIATNTSTNRKGLQSNKSKEIGGLSGRPLSSRSTEVIRFLSEKSKKAFPIIGVGGFTALRMLLKNLMLELI